MSGTWRYWYNQCTSETVVCVEPLDVISATLETFTCHCDWHFLMQVWKHLQKQLPGNRRDHRAHKKLPPSPSSSSTSSVCLSDCKEQQASSSTFYLAFSDDDNAECEVSIVTAKSPVSKCIHTMDTNSAQGGSHTPVNSTACRTHSDKDPAVADVKPTVQPKPKKRNKHLQQQQQFADGVSNNSREQTPALAMCSRGSLYPVDSLLSAQEPVQQTTSSVAKPLPPVRYYSVNQWCFQPVLGSQHW